MIKGDSEGRLCRFKVDNGDLKVSKDWLRKTINFPKIKSKNADNENSKGR